MNSEQPPLIWEVFGASVRGASHIRAELPNQDFISWYTRKSGVGPPLILAVSDGHGSAKSFRSHIGSELAVRKTQKTIKHLFESDLWLNNLSAIKRQIEERLPLDLVKVWRKSVARHLKANPFTEDEFAHLLSKEGETAVQAVKSNPWIAYGTTILVVILSNNFISYLQLGDGDILVVSDSSEVSWPLPKDKRLFADVTTSLCTDNAQNEFRVVFQSLAGSPPALILASSDGYSNSFRDEESFLRVGEDFLELLCSEGLEKVKGEIEGWLNEASHSGSGDDISLGIICRMDAIERNNWQINSQKLLDCEESEI